MVLHLAAGCGAESTSDGGGARGDASADATTQEDAAAPADGGGSDASAQEDAAAPGDGGGSDASPLDATTGDAALDGSVDAALDGAASDAGDVVFGCPAAFPNEVFRDDFDGTSMDGAKWNVTDQGPGGGTFTQLTRMRRENARVAEGKLVLSSMRHCEDPRANRAAPEHPTQCAGQNYYSGAWLKSVNAYAPSHGLMAFHAKMAPPVRGVFPALWARNTEGGDLYVELDLIEMSWDEKKGVEGPPDSFFVTSHFGAGAKYHAQGPLLQFPSLTAAYHVWEVEWDADAVAVRYYYRDAPGAARALLREDTAESKGFKGNVTAAQFAEGLRRGFRAYMDFAVFPDTPWTAGADTNPSYDPEDLFIDSVVICAPP